MLSPDIVYLVRKDQCADRLRAIERKQLIKAAEARQPVSRQKVAYWRGSQLVKWGSKLQRCKPNPLQSGRA